jgi:hypothetical protein
MYEGDKVALMTAGAYGMSMSSNYNTRPRAAEVLLVCILFFTNGPASFHQVLVEGAGYRIIRTRETIEDCMRGETL